MNSVQNCVVGSQVEPFQLSVVTPDLQHAQIQSADYQGRWLALIFYPHDFSFVCPTELTGFSAEKPQFDQLNCDLLGVSIDSLETHAQWLKTPANDGGVEGLRFPLASDPQGVIRQSSLSRSIFIVFVVVAWKDIRENRNSLGWEGQCVCGSSW